MKSMHYSWGILFALLMACSQTMTVQTVQAQEKKTDSGYNNPVISGFNPDPSVCRKDSDYYLVTSSFEYFPGVPIYHSKDLIHWEQIGHCLTRRSQLNLEKAWVSGGIFAPTIRYHKGTFYMITTNTSDKGNFIVHTKDPAGEWSDPVWLVQKGIDPSLFWDNDTCYLVSNPNGGICLSEINPITGEQLSPTKCIWYGTGGRYPEAPHIYKKDGYFYLTIAEGGTEYAHKVTVARAVDIYGPYTSNPANPILTHSRRLVESNPIQGTGHADFIQAHDGSWWTVFLGFRPGDGRHHVMGRETFLAPVEWGKGSWPVIYNKGYVDTLMITTTLPERPLKDNFSDASTDFSESQLGYSWMYIRNPHFENYSLKEKPGYLVLKATKKQIKDIASPTFVGTRQNHMAQTVSTNVQIIRPGKLLQTGLTVFQNPTHHYDVQLVRKGNDTYVQVHVRVGRIDYIAKEMSIPSQPATLKVVADKYSYVFYCNDTRLIDLDTRYLSSETASGFTGVLFGLFAQSNDGNGAAAFDWYKTK